MKNIILAPFALIAAGLFAMSTHVIATSLHHRTVWTPTTGTVIAAATMCEVTYQPADAVLRQVAFRGPCDEVGNAELPAGGSKPRIFQKEFGDISYLVEGTERRWEGALSDASLYNVKAGDTVAIVYNPAAPDVIDSAEPLEGWFGGMLIWGGSLAFLAFYVWLVWPRRKGPPPAVSNNMGQPLRGGYRSAGSNTVRHASTSPASGPQASQPRFGRSDAR